MRKEEENAMLYMSNVSFCISLHFIPSSYIRDTNNVQRKGDCMTLWAWLNVNNVTPYVSKVIFF